MSTKIVFNGDTAAGRAQWVPWLRSLELELDEWAWAVAEWEIKPELENVFCGFLRWLLCVMWYSAHYAFFVVIFSSF